jgi:hypothetical protein
MASMPFHNNPWIKGIPPMSSMPFHNNPWIKGIPPMSSMCLVWHLWWTSFPFQIFYNSLKPKKGPHRTGEKTTYKLGGDLIFSHGLVPRLERNLLLSDGACAPNFNYIQIYYPELWWYNWYFPNISCSLNGCWIIILFFKIHFSSKNNNLWNFGNKYRQILW